MPENKSPNEIAVSAKLDGGGLTASAKSRFISAIDRLLGSVAEIPATHFENIAAKMEKKGMLANELLEAEGRAAIKQLADDPNFGKVVADEFVKSNLRKLENKKKVVEASFEYLPSDEPNTEDSSDELDEDWLNSFESYVENASSNGLRDLWGRVLAGEVRKPRSFSRSTLRFIAELDQESARIFQDKTRVASSEGWIVRPPKMGGTLLEEFGFLQELGLILNIDGNIAATFKLYRSGQTHIQEQSIALVVTAKKDVTVPIVSLTRTGREVLCILPTPDPKAVLQSIFESIESQVETAELRTLVQANDGFIRFGNVLSKWK